MMARFRRNLRSSILTAFSALLFLSFLLVGAAFNLAVNQLIRSNAVAQLNESRAFLYAQAQIMDNMDNADSNAFFPSVLPTNDPRRNIFRANLNGFYIDEDFQIAEEERVPPDALDIALALRDSGLELSRLENQKFRVAERQYYLSAYNMRLVLQTEEDEEASALTLYMVYYVDITELIGFTNSINFLLISLVGSIWLMSVVVTTVLAGTIVRPLRNLSRFAERIGQGDFSPSQAVFHEVEFDNLSQCLNRAARQLAQYDNEQKTFFQNVSHELRTPLMSIKCYAEGIQYGLMVPEKASKTILEETDRLSDLVDDILYISRIDNITTAHAYERADLRNIIESCANQQRAVAEKRDIAIVLELGQKPAEISCVAKQMFRAVSNLISNAIRYAGSEVVISCRVQNAKVITTVRDDGPGLSPDILPRAFERFNKGKDGHNGIGLSIVKSVTEQHKGTVSAENGEKGAVFTLTLPLVNI